MLNWCKKQFNGSYPEGYKENILKICFLFLGISWKTNSSHLLKKKPVMYAFTACNTHWTQEDIGTEGPLIVQHVNFHFMLARYWLTNWKKRIEQTTRNGWWYCGCCQWRHEKVHVVHATSMPCQQVAIQAVLDGLKHHCIATDGRCIKAHLIIDFKMKYEPRSQRESTQEHFGKRGIGWHGALIIIYMMVDVKREDGSISRLPRRFNIYIDQIIAEGTTQVSVPTIIIFFINNIFSSHFCNQHHCTTIIIGFVDSDWTNRRCTSSYSCRVSIHKRSLITVWQCRLLSRWYDIVGYTVFE